MTNKEVRRFILKHARLDRDKLLATMPNGPRTVADVLRARREVEVGVVRYQPRRWFKRELTNAERIQFHRELGAMERDGLLLRIGWEAGSRTTHIKLNLGVPA